MPQSRIRATTIRALKSIAAVLVLIAAISTLPLRGQNPTASPQTLAPAASPELKLETEAVGPHRFIAAHGRRAVIAGYASQGLEIWAYPFQILNNYRVSFLPAGSTTVLDGHDLLSRVVYEPNSITRIYIGPDFIVHERLFVPLDQPGAILFYNIESRRAVEIQVRAVPILNLMWPAALGGQSIGWNNQLSAFLLTEPADGYSAAIGSPQIAAHDPPGNSTIQQSDLAFTLRPDASGAAQLFVALNSPHAAPGDQLHSLQNNAAALLAESVSHAAEYQKHVLQITTPDPRVNEAIAWSETALDQAWVCNPALGCGFVAGYGPSRDARRPQYDWFFAGDGLIAEDAALAAGDTERARAELEFILKYQDQATGMIWHELSQSAGMIDWIHKYPYMFVHVDVTFQFLEALGRYEKTSGDREFLRKHWSSIEQAYRYCLSTIDPQTHLPRIPSDKEGANEQDRMSDDLGLSSAWVAASAAVAAMASQNGNTALASDAAHASMLAEEAVPQHYWNAQDNFWISGHTVTGRSMAERRSGPAEALAAHLFSPQQTEAVLDQLATSAFQTSWGTRGIGLGSAGFDPQSYAKGSISAPHTAQVAQVFWQQNRPVTALEIWRSLLPWLSLDSLGHMHEVLAGNFYHPQVESVPEQTWSSAGFLTSTVHGLFGIELDGFARRLTFAPNLPPEWKHVSIAHLHPSSGGEVSLKLQQSSGTIALEISNTGDPFPLDFAPLLPLGATLQSTSLNGHSLAAKTESLSQETRAHLTCTIPHGSSTLTLHFNGGVSVIPPTSVPLLGEPDRAIHILAARLNGRSLSIDADLPHTDSALILATPWKVKSVQGGSAKQIAEDQWELVFAPPASLSDPASFHRGHAVLDFQ